MLQAKPARISSKPPAEAKIKTQMVPIKQPKIKGTWEDTGTVRKSSLNIQGTLVITPRGTGCS